jgi:hypothetical protein
MCARVRARVRDGLACACACVRGAALLTQPDAAVRAQPEPPVLPARQRRLSADSRRCRRRARRRDASMRGRRRSTAVADGCRRGPAARAGKHAGQRIGTASADSCQAGMPVHARGEEWWRREGH